VAEQWLIGQEPYLQNEDLGDTLDQVENLIKKHEAFEKSIVAQEDRFNALKRLTTLELKKQQQEEKKAQEEKPNYLSQYLEEFKTLEEKEQDQLRQQEIAEKEAKRIEAENLQKVKFFFLCLLFSNKFFFKKAKSDISDSSKTSGGDTLKESTKIGI
jgi:spectrin beta